MKWKAKSTLSVSASMWTKQRHHREWIVIVIWITSRYGVVCAPLFVIVAFSVQLLRKRLIFNAKLVCFDFSSIYILDYFSVATHPHAKTTVKVSWINISLFPNRNTVHSTSDSGPSRHGRSLDRFRNILWFVFKLICNLWYFMWK